MGGAEDNEGAALEGAALVGLVGFEGFEIGAADAGDGGGAVDGELDGVVGVGLELAVVIGDFDGDVGEILGVGAEGGAVGGEADGGGVAGGAQFVFGCGFSGDEADGFEGAGGVGDGELSAELLGAGGGFFVDEMAVEEELYGIAAGVDVDLDEAAVVVGPGPVGGVGPQAPVGGADFGAVELGLEDGDVQFFATVPDDVAVVGDGFAEAGDVDIAAVGAVPGVEFVDAVGDVAFVIEVPATDAGFAEVVEGGPEEVAEDVGMVFGEGPVGEGFALKGFGGDDDAAGDASDVGLVEVDMVVVAGEVEEGEEFVAIFPFFAGFPGSIDGGGDGSGGIEGADFGGERLADLLAGLEEAFVHFVADAPDDDGGVVEVAGDHRFGIDEGPVLEFEVVVVGGFGGLPVVEDFIHDEHAEAIAGVEEGGRGGIVGGAEGVEAGVFEDFDAAEFGAVEGGGAEWAVVMMEAAAVEFDGLAVDLEAIFGGPGDGADAEGGFESVGDFSGDGECGDDFVKSRRLRGPEGGVGDEELLFDLGGGAGGELRRGLGAGEFLAFGRSDNGLESDFAGVRGGVGGIGFEAHGGAVCGEF